MDEREARRRFAAGLVTATVATAATVGLAARDTADRVRDALQTTAQRPGPVDRHRRSLIARAP